MVLHGPPWSSVVLQMYDYILGAPQTKQATRSTKIIGVTFTEALAKCQNSESALAKGVRRGDVYINPRGFYCFKREEDRSLGLVSHSYLTNQGPIAAYSKTHIEDFWSSPSNRGTGFFFARLFVPVARLFLLSNLLWCGFVCGPKPDTDDQGQHGSHIVRHHQVEYYGPSDL